MITDTQVQRTGDYEGQGPKKGNRFYLYHCPAGKVTIGRGINLEAGLDPEEEDFIFRHRLELAYEQALMVFPNLEEFSRNRKETLVDMVFNLGLAGFVQFKKFIKAVQDGDWQTAAVELQDSLWFKQVGRRAKEAVVFIMEG